MKWYDNKLILWVMAIIIAILLFIIFTPKAEMSNDTDEIKRFNNCIVFGRVPVRYITDTMIVEKCLPYELLEVE